MQSYQKNNIIAVCSSANGLGVTWLASALAQVVAAKHKKTLFFDASGGRNNIAETIGFKTSDAYQDILKGGQTLNLLAKPVAKCHFDVIAADPHQDTIETYPVGRAQILALDLKNFAATYDNVFIDCGRKNAALQNMMLSIASKIILILTPSTSDLTGAYAQLEQIKKIAPSAQLYVAVNHALNAAEGEHTYQTLCSAAQKFMSLPLNLLGIVCQDGRIKDCTLNKTTIFERYPLSNTIKSLSLMADCLQKDENNAL